MNLQMRLRHALGTRMVDLAPRGADQPLVVGRGTSADVQVPSTTVAPSHCQLFHFEGQWVVQDSNSPTGTYVNGDRIIEPTVLNFGDVITLGTGAKAPALEVDPLGVGRASVKPVREEVNTAPATQPAAAFPPPQPAGRVAQVPGWQRQVPAEPADEWGSIGAAATAKPGAYRRPQKKQSGSLVGITIGCTAAIVLIAGVIFYQLSQRDKNPKVIKIVTTGSGGGGGGDGTIFSTATQTGPEKRTPKPTAKEVEKSVAAALAARDARDAAAADPGTPDDTTADPAEAPTTRPKTGLQSDPDLWNNLAGQPPALAINVAERYLYSKPKTPLKADLEKFEATQYQSLWWKRIADLCEARNRHTDAIADLKEKIAEASGADFKLEKKKLLEREMELWDKYNKDLTENFVYLRKDPPSFDETQAPLAGDMKTKFAEWKTQIRLQIVRKAGDIYGPLQ